jgi:uncharacterized membrane protein
MQREDKKAQFEQPRKRNPFPLVAIALCIVVAAGLAFAFLGGDSAPTVNSVRADQGSVSIPLTQINDGKAHFFTIRSDGADVRFFVLKSNDGVVRAAFDTCDVCYRYNQGYRQEGDFMVCNACDQRFRSDQVNEIKGGCNPAPLERTIVGDKLVIAEADIGQGAWYFKGN